MGKISPSLILVKDILTQTGESGHDFQTVRACMPRITPALISRFDVAGPHYTSYPTVDRFVEAFGEADYLQALAQRRDCSVLGTRPLSLYVHLPFCASLCLFCACNKIITRRRDVVAPYLRDLEREARLQTQHLGARPRVSQLHLGGGSPTFLSDAELAELMALLKRHFAFVPGGEYSIELDPRTVDAARLAALRALGFNRISLGVQDFDPQVQKAVHRVQPARQVFDLVAAARALDFESINVDLIHGLPRQNPEAFAVTLAQVAELRPDRIALYGYAHLPERFRAQRRIDATELPGAGARVAMLAQAIARFQRAGYVHIGMDHFALPTDALAVARRQGRLHRGFQGYGTQPDSDLIGLGVSAIGKVGATYSQNARDLADYRERLERGHLPVQRGLALSRDDLVRRTVIMALMCQGLVAYESVELAHLIDFRSYFASELGRLRRLQDDGLVRLADGAIALTPLGWFFARGVAMVFDKYLQARRSRARFSRIL